MLERIAIVLSSLSLLFIYYSYNDLFVSRVTRYCPIDIFVMMTNDVEIRKYFCTKST